GAALGVAHRVHCEEHAVDAHLVVDARRLLRFARLPGRTQIPAIRERDVEADAPRVGVEGGAILRALTDAVVPGERAELAELEVVDARLVHREADLLGQERVIAKYRRVLAVGE